MLLCSEIQKRVFNARSVNYKPWRDLCVQNVSLFLYAKFATSILFSITFRIYAHLRGRLLERGANKRYFCRYRALKEKILHSIVSSGID